MLKCRLALVALIAALIPLLASAAQSPSRDRGHNRKRGLQKTIWGVQPDFEVPLLPRHFSKASKKAHSDSRSLATPQAALVGSVDDVVLSTAIDSIPETSGRSEVSVNISLPKDERPPTDATETGPVDSSDAPARSNVSSLQTDASSATSEEEQKDQQQNSGVQGEQEDLQAEQKAEEVEKEEKADEDQKVQKEQEEQKDQEKEDEEHEQKEKEEKKEIEEKEQQEQKESNEQEETEKTEKEEKEQEEKKEKEEKEEEEKKANEEKEEQKKKEMEQEEQEKKAHEEEEEKKEVEPKENEEEEKKEKAEKEEEEEGKKDNEEEADKENEEKKENEVKEEKDDKLEKEGNGESQEKEETDQKEETAQKEEQEPDESEEGTGREGDYQDEDKGKEEEEPDEDDQDIILVQGNKGKKIHADVEQQNETVKADDHHAGKAHSLLQSTWDAAAGFWGAMTGSGRSAKETGVVSGSEAEAPPLEAPGGWEGGLAHGANFALYVAPPAALLEGGNRLAESAASAIELWYYGDYDQ